MTVNSSPLRRYAEVPELAKVSLSLPEKATRAASPARWPARSLICLKLLRSMMARQ